MARVIDFTKNGSAVQDMAIGVTITDPEFYTTVVVNSAWLKGPFEVKGPYFWSQTQTDIYEPIPRSIALLMSGVRPDDPISNIHCGRYPGIMYPHPGTLYLSGVLNLNEAEYTRLTPPDQYSPGYGGLGIANPANNIGHPGFLLGLFDTYCRMACYLNFWAGVRAGEDADGPIIPVSINLKNYNTQGTTQLQFSDLYPNFAEVPTDFIANAIPNQPYNPQNIPFDFEVFRGIMSHGGYNGIPEQFRDYFDQLWEIAQGMQTQVRHGYWGGHIGTTNPQYARYYGNMGLASKEFKGYYSILFDTFCQSMPKAQAISLVTGGDEEFHGSGPSSYDYRSIPELLAVLNIMPVQATYTKIIGWSTTPIEDSELGTNYPRPSLIGCGRVQVLIHVLNPNPEPVSIDIDGLVTIDRGIHAPPIEGAGYHDEMLAVTEENPTTDQWIERMPTATLKNMRPGGRIASSIICSAIASNRYNHDGNYFGIGQGQSSQSAFNLYEVNAPSTGFLVTSWQPIVDPTTPWTDVRIQWEVVDIIEESGENYGVNQTTELPFNRTISLRPGLNSISIDLETSCECDALPPCTVPVDTYWGVTTYAPHNADNRLDNVTFHIKIGDYFETTVKLDGQTGWGNYPDFGAAEPPAPPSPFPD